MPFEYNYNVKSTTKILSISIMRDAKKYNFHNEATSDSYNISTKVITDI